MQRKALFLLLALIAISLFVIPTIPAAPSDFAVSEMHFFTPDGVIGLDSSLHFFESQAPYFMNTTDNNIDVGEFVAIIYANSQFNRIKMKIYAGEYEIDLSTSAPKIAIIYAKYDYETLDLYVYDAETGQLIDDKHLGIYESSKMRGIAIEYYDGTSTTYVPFAAFVLAQLDAPDGSLVSLVGEAREIVTKYSQYLKLIVDAIPFNYNITLGSASFYESVDTTKNVSFVNVYNYTNEKVLTVWAQGVAGEMTKTFDKLGEYTIRASDFNVTELYYEAVEEQQEEQNGTAAPTQTIVFRVDVYDAFSYEPLDADIYVNDTKAGKAFQDLSIECNPQAEQTIKIDCFGYWQKMFVGQIYNGSRFLVELRPLEGPEEKTVTIRFDAYDAETGEPIANAIVRDLDRGTVYECGKSYSIEKGYKRFKFEASGYKEITFTLWIENDTVVPIYAVKETVENGTTSVGTNCYGQGQQFVEDNQPSSAIFEEYRAGLKLINAANETLNVMIGFECPDVHGYEHKIKVEEFQLTAGHVVYKDYDLQALAQQAIGSYYELAFVQANLAYAYFWVYVNGYPVLRIPVTQCENKYVEVWLYKPQAQAGATNVPYRSAWSDVQGFQPAPWSPWGYTPYTPYGGYGNMNSFIALFIALLPILLVFSLIEKIIRKL